MLDTRSTLATGLSGVFTELYPGPVMGSFVTNEIESRTAATVI